MCPIGARLLWLSQNLELSSCLQVIGDIAALASCANLQSLILSDCPQVTGDIAALASCADLKVLYLHGCSKAPAPMAAAAPPNKCTKKHVIWRNCMIFIVFY